MKPKGEERPKYCSVECVKRGWYIRNLSDDVDSIFSDSDGFWDTETGFGYMWEKYAADVMGAEHLEFNGRGADLKWGNELVDVKACSLNKRKFKRGKPVVNDQKGAWVFNRGKLKNIDWFFCLALVDNRIEKRFLIPGSVFPLGGITLGWVSKYDEYLV